MVWFLDMKATLDKLYHNFSEEDATGRKCFFHSADNTNVRVIATITNDNMALLASKGGDWATIFDVIRKMLTARKRRSEPPISDIQGRQQGRWNSLVGLIIKMLWSDLSDCLLFRKWLISEADSEEDRR
jgi:hypothetical protein